VHTYENGKLVDDSVDHYLRVVGDRFRVVPVSVQLVDSPDRVAAVRQSGLQTYIRWFDNNVIDALSRGYAKYKNRYVFHRAAFASAGPIVDDMAILNFGTSDLALPGRERFRVRLQVSAPAGVKEVALLDGGSATPWRRFLPGGKKVFTQCIDHFHDREYNLVARVTDVNGRQAIGWAGWTSVQENYFARCSDNLNTMPRGKWYAKPEHLLRPRGFEAYPADRGFVYRGFPEVAGLEETQRPAVEYHPVLAGRFGSVVDCRMHDHYPPTASPNLDHTDQSFLAVPNEYLVGQVRHTLYTPWHDGPMAVMVDADLAVKKAFRTPQAAVFRPNYRRATCFFVDRPGDTGAAGVFSSRVKGSRGPLPVGACVGVYPDPMRGSIGAIALADGLHYVAERRGSYGSLRLHLAGPRDYRPGDRLRYRYLAIASQIDPPTDNRYVADICRTMGVGTQPAYRVEPTIGSVASTQFILRLQAKDRGFAGRITQAQLPIQLPVHIAGLNPNWDAGIWYKGKTRLAVAVWCTNPLGQRYVQRQVRQATDRLIHIPVLADGTGVLQVDTEIGPKQVFIGNLLVSDVPTVVLTLTDTRNGKAAFVAHNPTDQAIQCTVRPGPGFLLLGPFQKRVTVPAGQSLTVPIPG